MKIAVIGGGSTYTPELVNGFLDRIKSLPVTELWLMDIDPQRLEIVGGFAQRMVAARGNPFKVVLTTDQRLAWLLILGTIRVAEPAAEANAAMATAKAFLRGAGVDADTQWRPELPNV